MSFLIGEGEGAAILGGGAGAAILGGGEGAAAGGWEGAALLFFPVLALAVLGCAPLPAALLIARRAVALRCQSCPDLASGWGWEPQTRAISPSSPILGLSSIARIFLYSPNLADLPR